MRCDSQVGYDNAAGDHINLRCSNDAIAMVTIKWACACEGQAEATLFACERHSAGKGGVCGGCGAPINQGEPIMLERQCDIRIVSPRGVVRCTELAAGMVTITFDCCHHGEVTDMVCRRHAEEDRTGKNDNCFDCGAPVLITRAVLI